MSLLESFQKVTEIQNDGNHPIGHNADFFFAEGTLNLIGS